MVPGGSMAEARPDTPKKYTCACGLAQEDKKSKFLGKCRHCHTRAKYLRGQSSFDCGSASRWGGSGSSGSSPISSTAASSANSSDGDGGHSSSSSSSRSSSSAGGGGVAATTTTASASIAAATTTTTTTTARPAGGGGGRAVRVTAPSGTRRRSRSMDRYDAYRVMDPPPYSWVAPGVREGAREVVRGRGAGVVRRAESEDSARAPRSTRINTPPPPYEVAQSQSYYQFPPSYEEALANSLAGVRVSTATNPLTQQPLPPPDPASTRPSLLPPSVTSTAALLPVGILSSRTSRVLEEQAAVLEAQRETQLEAQRQAQREAQLERERDMERQRIRELQLAQYCGCAKCQVPGGWPHTCRRLSLLSWLREHLAALPDRGADGGVHWLSLPR